LKLAQDLLSGLGTDDPVTGLIIKEG
jgi:hypothetical protein